MKLLLQVEATADPIIVPAGGEIRLFPVVNQNLSDFPNAYLHDPVTNTIRRAPFPGKYRFSGIVSADFGDAGSVRLAIQREAGAARYGGIGRISALSPVILDLAAGEEVSFRVYNPGASDVTLQSGPEYNYGLMEFVS